MAQPYSYGSGTATQFTTGEQRQVLELGEKIHMFNPDVTPIFTVTGRLSTSSTPVPIFEWMEDEYFIRPDVKLATSASTVQDRGGSAGDNDTGFIIRMQRQAQFEAFEKGGLYTVSDLGAGVFEFEGAATDVLLMCVALGQECQAGTVGGAVAASELDVAFVHSDGTLPAFRYDKNGTTVAGFAYTATSTITFTYVGNVGECSDLDQPGHSATQTNLTDNETATVYRSRVGWREGANIGEMTSKKVRRLSNCTQIFREPYSITGTQNAAKMYGGSEMSRLQARKLNKIKMDLEYAILTNGAKSLDATAENPQRTMAGLGVGGTAGVIQSLNADVNAELKMTETYSSSAVGGLGEMDDVLEKVFQDSLSGSMKKTAFCSNRWLKKLVGLARTDSNTSINAEMGSNATAGLRVTKYFGPIGEMDFVVHPLLNSTLDAYAVCLDFANISWRPLATRDMQLRTNVIQDGRDGQTNEWLIEAGMEVRNEQTHAILKLV